MTMIYLRALLVLQIGVLLAPNLVGQQLPEPRLVDNQLLASVLNFAFVEDLQTLPTAPVRDPTDLPLLLKLYSVLKQGGCVDGTHWVCSFDYYLAVHE